MFCLILDLVPTAALTFRRIPFSTLHLATYPFVPPTVLSGFLRRLWMLAEGEELPLTGEHAPNDLNRYFVLPKTFCPLGAYPQGWYRIHRTRRHGIRKFNHTEFSRLHRLERGENLQLYTWEYLLCERMKGYVLHREQRPLAVLAERVINRGCKIGKEGFVYVENTTGPIPLSVQEIEATPNVFVAGIDASGVPGDIYTLYRYEWEEPSIFHEDQPGQRQPSPVKEEGFRPFTAVLTREKVKLRYFTDGQDIFIPCSTVEAVGGDME